MIGVGLQKSITAWGKSGNIRIKFNINLHIFNTQLFFVLSKAFIFFSFIIYYLF